MYPKPFLELSGQYLRSFACGANTFSCTVEGDQKFTVAWGGALYGELGYGKGGKKSSANPDQAGSGAWGAVWAHPTLLLHRALSLRVCDVRVVVAGGGVPLLGEGSGVCRPFSFPLGFFPSRWGKGRRC